METEKKQELMASIEAILFAMGGVVEEERLAQALEIDRRTVYELVHELMHRLDDTGSGLQVIELEDGYQMCTRREQYQALIRIAKVPKKIQLTNILMETLSIIAYKQPVTKMEIEKIRGVKSDHVINKLIEYDLVRELGRLDAIGRPIVFGTTVEFLRHFGIGSLDELPQIDPVQREDFKQEAQQEIDAKLKV